MHHIIIFPHIVHIDILTFLSTLFTTSISTSFITLTYKLYTFIRNTQMISISLISNKYSYTFSST